MQTVLFCIRVAEANIPELNCAFERFAEIFGVRWIFDYRFSIQDIGNAIC